MSVTKELELARAQARYYRDRVALMRAKHYRWGVGSSPRLEQLERELLRAERRLSELRSQQAAVPAEGESASEPSDGSAPELS